MDGWTDGRKDRRTDATKYIISLASWLITINVSFAMNLKNTRLGWDSFYFQIMISIKYHFTNPFCHLSNVAKVRALHMKIDA